MPQLGFFLFKKKKKSEAVFSLVHFILDEFLVCSMFSTGQ